MIKDHGLQVLAPTVSVLAQSERELMAMSVKRQAMRWVFMRRMALDPLCYAQLVKKAFTAVPFKGDLLLGLFSFS